MCCGSLWGELLAENTSSHGDLTQGDEGGDFQGAEGEAVAAGVGEEREVEGQGFDVLAALSAGGAFAADLLGSAAVVVVLTPEGGEGEVVEVLDDGFGNEAELPAATEPAGAKFTVLGGGEAEVFVEATGFVKAGAGEGEVVGGSKGGEGGIVDAARVAGEVVVDAVEELLTRFGTGVVGQSVRNVAVEGIGGVGGMGGEEGGKPGGIGNAVVIDEDEKVAEGLGGAGIAGGARAAIGLAEAVGAIAPSDGFQGFRAAVIDDDDLELIGGQAAGAEPLKAVGEGFRPPIGRNYDGDGNRHYRGGSRFNFQSSAAVMWEPSAQNLPGGMEAVQAAEKASIL